jgi:hypothetical protein
MSFDPKTQKLLRFEVESWRPPWLSRKTEGEVRMGKRGHTEEAIGEYDPKTIMPFPVSPYFAKAASALVSWLTRSSAKPGAINKHA